MHSTLAVSDALEARILLASDFGDAPAPYPVTLAENGARHTVVGSGSPRLGPSFTDTEANGVHSDLADADSDEDGVIFGLVYARQGEASVIVKVRNTGLAKLDAWIDFNADGDWADAGEQVFDSITVQNGIDHNLSFPVPADAIVGTTYSRFRISLAGDLDPTGEAPDGEVEDHKLALTFAPPNIAAPLGHGNDPEDVTGTYRVDFEWIPAAQAVNYEIWVRSYNYLNLNEFHRTIVSGTSYTPDVDFGVGHYTVWMRSIGTGNVKSAWTPDRNFTVVSKTTILPMAKYQNTATPTVSWNPILGAESYKVWISNLSTGQSPVIFEENITQTSFTPASDLPVGLYRAWVQVWSGAASGGWSLPFDFHVSPAPVITQGMNSTFDRTPTFAWNAVSGATSYEFQLKNRNTGAMVIAQTVAGTSLTPGSNLPDGPYRWFVRGRSDQNVYSLWTTATDIYVGGRTDVLMPTGNTSDTTPTFSWRPVDGASRYELWLSRLDVPSVVINKTDNTTTSFTPATALAAGSYRVWVRAVSTTNEFGPWSIPVTFNVTMPDSDSRDDVLMPLVAATDLRIVIFEEPTETVESRENQEQRFAASLDAVVSDGPEAFSTSHRASASDPDLFCEIIDVAIAEWVRRLVGVA